jgi:hypothetical protein
VGCQLISKRRTPFEQSEKPRQVFIFYRVPCLDHRIDDWHPRFKRGPVDQLADQLSVGGIGLPDRPAGDLGLGWPDPDMGTSAS